MASCIAWQKASVLVMQAVVYDEERATYHLLKTVIALLLYDGLAW